MNFYQKIRFSLQIRLCFLADRLAMRSPKTKPKTLLVVRTDAIGDYLLFRNFLEILKKSDAYKDYQITLLGNEIWKDLTENFDKSYLHDCIWIDRKRFFWDIFYRYQIQRKVNKAGFEVAVHSVFSEEFLYGFSVVRVSEAKQRIGNQGDSYNIIEKERKISKNYFTKILPCSPKVLFEFDRNKEFFENLLHQKIHLEKPFLNPKKFDLEGLEKFAYVILFPSASTPNRRWDIKNFEEIGFRIFQKYGLKIVLAGASSDKHLGENFEKIARFPILNFIGKTSLSHFADLINNCTLLISNETSAVHFAAVCSRPAVCISNNTWHLGRFNPYPEKMGLLIDYVFDDNIDQLSFEQARQEYPASKMLNINDIAVEKVFLKAEKYLLNRNTD